MLSHLGISNCADSVDNFVSFNTGGDTCISYCFSNFHVCSNTVDCVPAFVFRVILGFSRYSAVVLKQITFSAKCRLSWSPALLDVHSGNGDFWTTRLARSLAGPGKTSWTLLHNQWLVCRA